LLVYAGEGEEHITFMTPEAYNAVKEYLDFRASYGEQITGDSWVLRNAFRTVDMKGNVGQQAKATEPKKLSQKGITRLLIRAW
jgi:hypothetical protein